jgi:hypothetical protein
MTKMSKQGVPILKTPKPVHVHRYAPSTFTDRAQRQVTVMKCVCGAVDAVDRSAEDESL